jgi:hypothetical protein
VAYAADRYAAEGVEYRCGDAHALTKLGVGPFDVIVSFETLEHVERPDLLLEQLKALAHDDTVFVVSVPNEAHLAEGINAFHLHRFDREQFEALLAPHFPARTILPQYFTVASLIDGAAAQTVPGLAVRDGVAGRIGAVPQLPGCYLAVCHQKAAVPVRDGLVSGERFFAEWVEWFDVLERERQAWVRAAEERADAVTALQARCAALEEGAGEADEARAWAAQAETAHGWVREMLDEERRQHFALARRHEDVLLWHEEVARQKNRLAHRVAELEGRLAEAPSGQELQRQLSDVIPHAHQLERRNEELARDAEGLRRRNEELARDALALDQRNAELAWDNERQRAEVSRLAAEVGAARQRWEALERTRGYRALMLLDRRILNRETRRGRFLRSGARIIFRMLRAAKRGAHAVRGLLRR